MKTGHYQRKAGSARDCFSARLEAGKSPAAIGPRGINSGSEGAAPSAEGRYISSPDFLATLGAPGLSIKPLAVMPAVTSGQASATQASPEDYVFDICGVISYGAATPPR